MKISNIISPMLLMQVVSLSAQNPSTVEMADALHQNGKIYVVIASVVIIFIVLFLYLFSIDRKVSRIIKKLEKEEKPS